MTEIELPYVTIHYESPVVIYTYKSGAQIGIAEIKELVSLAEGFSEGKPYVTFSDVRQSVSISDTARNYVANPRNMPLFRGSAILVTTTLYSFAVNFASFFLKKTFPLKAFVTEEKAMEWLRGLPLEGEGLSIS